MFHVKARDSDARCLVRDWDALSDQRWVSAE